MFKKLSVILCCLTIILGATLSLVFYFSFRPTAEDDFVFSLQDVTLREGEENKIEYTSSEDGEVKFSAVDQAVAVVVDGNKIKAVAQGQTFLNAYLKVNDKTYFQVAQITVLKQDQQSPENGDKNNGEQGGEADDGSKTPDAEEEDKNQVGPAIDKNDNNGQDDNNDGQNENDKNENDKTGQHDSDSSQNPPETKPQDPVKPSDSQTQQSYTVKLVQLQGGTYADGVLTVQSAALFSVELYHNGEKIQFSDFQACATENITLSRQLMFVYVAATQNGTITFQFPEVGVSVEIQLIVAV